MAGHAKSRQPARVKKRKINQAIHLLTDGKTWEETAADLDVPMSTIYRWVLADVGPDSIGHLIAADTIAKSDSDDSPAKVRNQLNARQFILERRYHRLYGKKDRLDIDVSHRIIERLHRARDAQIIDVDTHDEQDN